MTIRGKENTNRNPQKKRSGPGDVYGSILGNDDEAAAAANAAFTTPSKFHRITLQQQRRRQQKNVSSYLHCLPLSEEEVTSAVQGRLGSEERLYQNMQAVPPGSASAAASRMGSGTNNSWTPSLDDDKMSTMIAFSTTSTTTSTTSSSSDCPLASIQTNDCSSSSTTTSSLLLLNEAAAEAVRPISDDKKDEIDCGISWLKAANNKRKVGARLTDYRGCRRRRDCRNPVAWTLLGKEEEDDESLDQTKNIGIWQKQKTSSHPPSTRQDDDHPSPSVPKTPSPMPSPAAVRTQPPLNLLKPQPKRPKGCAFTF
jgi:hypothetical protein